MEYTSKHDISFSRIKIETKKLIDIIKLKKIQIVIVSLATAICGFLFAYIDKPTYVANTRFMLKNEGVGSLFGGQMTGLTSLLGGGQMGTPLERTAEVISSDRIVGRTLLREVFFQGKKDLLINHFLRLEDKNKLGWKSEKAIMTIQIPSAYKNISELSYRDRKIFKYVKNLLIPEKKLGIVRKLFDKKSGVLTISCVYQDEEFAILLSNSLYFELSNFFIEQMTYSSTNNANVVKIKLDSIELELNNTRKQYARLTDQSLGLLLQQDKVELKALSVKEQMLNIMYAEALKNFESFQFINQAAMPSLTLIDAPYSPLLINKKNVVVSTFFSLIIGIILSIIYFRMKIII